MNYREVPVPPQEGRSQLSSETLNARVRAFEDLARSAVPKAGYQIKFGHEMLGNVVSADFYAGSGARRSRWRDLRWRARAWWWRNRPTFHLGPCDHEDCW